MASKTQPQRSTDCFGRSVQPKARDIYHKQTRVLDRGLHLDRKRAHWQDPKPEPQLAQAVERAVRSRLPLRPDPKSYHDYDALAADCTASIAFLRVATQDLRQFIDALVEVNNSYLSSSGENAALRQTFWDSYYGDTAKQVMSSLIPPAVILSAELEGMFVEFAAMHLCKKLDRMVESFGKGVADAFAELQSAELIGRVDWPVPTACDSFYYEDTVLHEYLGREVVDVSSPVEVSVDYQRRVRRVRQEVKTVSTDRHVVRHGIHIKIVGKAEKSSIAAFPKVVPEHVRRLLEMTPDWLCDLTEIVWGKLRTDIVVAREIFVEERELVEKEEEEEEYDWREPDSCPLVTVGDYVLTGWGESEANVETARQKYGLLYWLAVALVVLAAISMGLARLTSPLWSYVAPLAASLSVAAFVEACRKRAIARGEVAGMGRLLAGGLSWLLLALGLMALAVGVATVSWILGAGGALVTGIGGVLLRRALRGT